MTSMDTIARWATLAGSLASLVLAAGCTDNELDQLDPDVFVAPESLDFGTVTVGAESAQLVTVHNVGGGTLHVDSVTMADGAAGFQVEDFDGGLAADESVELLVSFLPDELGPAEDVIQVVSDDPDEAVVDVPVWAVDVLDSPVPAIAWSPSSLDWGQVVSGAEVTLSVTVSSVGTADLELSSVTLDPTSSAEFVIVTDPSPVTLPTSYTTQIDVVYAPVDEVADVGELIVASNDPDTPEARIPLSGELLPAPDIELVPTQLLFGAVEVGQSVTMDAEIWSLGDADLELGTLVQTGSDEFLLETNPGQEVLAPGESALLTVTYTPTDLNPDAGAVEIPSNDPDEPLVTLLLSGEHEAVPDIEVTPLEVDFGLVDQGTAVTDAVMVTNVGTGDLMVEAPVITGSPEFSISAAQFPTTIAAGASELMLVSYAPADLSSDTGEITITSDDPDEPTVVVDLLGSASPIPDIELQPPLLQFGLILPGNTAVMDATVSNVGTSDLTLGSLFLDAGAEFTMSVDPSGAVLSPGDSTPIEVTYAPINQGMDTGVVEIPSDDPDEPLIYLLLSGSEQPIPDIVVTPLLVDFGQVDVGLAQTELVTVSNVGGADLDVTGLSLSGAAEFSYSAANLPGTLTPGAQELVEVTYTPVDDLADTGTLTVASADPDEATVDVALQGEATPEPDIDVDPWTVDFGDVTVDDTVIDTVSVLNVGDADLLIYGCSYNGAPNLWVSSCPQGAVILPGGSEPMEVTFHPDAELSYAGLVDITSTDPDEPVVTVELLGGGAAPDIDLVPTALDFGNVPVNGSLTLDAEIWNVGAGDLELGVLVQYGSAEFVMDVDPSGEILGPGDVTTVTVTYWPVDLQADNGQIQIPSNDPDEAVVTLSLLGEYDPVADIDVDPLQIDFGVQDMGTTSQDQVTVTNVGSGDLSVDLPTLTGSTDFSITANSFPVTLSPGVSRTIHVTYGPSDMVADSAQIEITSDDPDEPLVIVELAGSPTPEPDIYAVPTTLSFGAIQIGNSSALTVNVSNVGSADLELGTLTLNGAGDFAITVDPSLSVLSPGDSTLLEVTYAPTNNGNDSGYVDIPSNDPDEPVVQIDLSGSEEPVPDIDVDPLLVDFGVVDIGLSPSDIVAVSNVGGTSLTVSNLTLSGSADFSYVSNWLPGSIGVGATRNVSVVYTPSDDLADTATLTIDSDDPDEPSVVVDIVGSPAEEPDILVDPLVVDFGLVKTNTAETEWVTITNVGDADLDVYNCVPYGNSFAISSNPAGTLLGPGDSTQMSVTFEPTSEIAYSGRVDISSNDPDEPIVQVDLLGEGAAPAIAFDPALYDFGQVGLSCEETLDIAVQSVGNAPLVLYGYSYASLPPVNAMTLDPGQLDDYVNNGWELQPGQEITVTVSFLPDDMATFDGLLSVSSDDPDDPVLDTAQYGEGYASGDQTDSFVQQGNNWADVLWVVDNSCSMEDEQGLLGDDFSYFYSIINNAGVDYHVSVVTTDDEDFQGASYKVIDDNTPNGAGQFAANCAVGTTGYMYERGLQYGYDALVKAENNTYPNSGFWRDDAGLRLIYVSDEPDQSGSWSQYLTWYQDMKANPDHVIMSAICGTNGYQAASCVGPGGSADPGTGYVDVANATGGVLGTICDSDWSTALANIGWISVTLADTFTLTLTPVAQTIEVYVNGSQLLAGWSYDAGLNAVIFDPAYVPANGDSVDIHYGYAGPC